MKFVVTIERKSVRQRREDLSDSPECPTIDWDSAWKWERRRRRCSAIRFAFLGSARNRRNSTVNFSTNWRWFLRGSSRDLPHHLRRHRRTHRWCTKIDSTRRSEARGMIDERQPQRTDSVRRKRTRFHRFRSDFSTEESNGFRRPSAPSLTSRNSNQEKNVPSMIYSLTQAVRQSERRHTSASIVETNGFDNSFFSWHSKQIEDEEEEEEEGVPWYSLPHCWQRVINIDFGLITKFVSTLCWLRTNRRKQN